MSLLRSQGHVEPHHYPVWMIWEEAITAKRRLNRQYQTEATVIMQAVASANVGGKKGAAAMNKFLENFDDG